jgi:hypothetical protein
MDLDIALSQSEERRTGKLRMRDLDEFELMTEDEQIAPKTPGKVPQWTVRQDDDESISDTIDSSPALDMRVEDDKENAKPDPVVLQGRRKGTGGRLSLVAQEDASSLMDTNERESQGCSQ